MAYFLRVDVPRFQRQRLDVSVPWNGRSRLMLNGKPVRLWFGKGEVLDDAGKTVKVVVRRRLPDPYPTVRLDEHLVRFGQPWRWYEWLWSFLPIVLAIGGLSGLVAAWVGIVVNGRILRSRFSAPFRYLASLLVVLAFFAVLLDLAWVLRPHR